MVIQLREDTMDRVCIFCLETRSNDHSYTNCCSLRTAARDVTFLMRKALICTLSYDRVECSNHRAQPVPLPPFCVSNCQLSKEIVLAYALEFVFIIILKNISAIILIYVLSYSSLVGLIIGCLLAVAIIVVIVMRFLFPDCKYTYLQIQYCDTLFPIYTTLHHTPLS